MKSENTSHSIYKLKSLYDYFESNTDIKDYISQVSGARFTKQGKNWKCRSPLNSNDKNPSFTITDGKQVFYCFSTGYGGNIVSFAEKFYNLDRDSAISKIAEELHLDLSDFVSDKLESYESYSDVLQKSLDYCVKKAKSSEVFISFFRARGITSLDFLLSNKIGYCDSAGVLGDHLSISGCDMSVVESLGLLSDDRMTNSIVFPVYDRFGNIIRFVCRPINGNTKYINTIEYSGGNTDVLMGINNIVPYDGVNPLIVVEGAIDYLALLNVGYKNVVAMCGLKLPHDFMNRVSKLNYDAMCVWVDGDIAGRNFVYKIFDSIQEYSKYGVLLKVIHYNEKDPDAVVRSVSIKNVLADAVYLPIWAVTNRLLSIEDTTLQTSYVIKSGVNLIGVGYELYLQWASVILDTPKDALHYSIASMSKRAIADAESERILLSVILHNQNAISYYDINSDIFYIPQHKRIASMVIADGMSYDSVYYALKDDQYMSQLVGNLPSPPQNGIHDIIKSLKVLHKHRSIHSVLLDGIDKVSSPDVSPEDLMSDLEDKISVIQNQSNAVLEHGNNILVQVIDELVSRTQSNARLTLLSDNWKRFNSIVFGLVSKKLYIIQAPTGHGKTTWALNWVNDFTIDSGVPCLFFSGEMDKAEIIRRLASIQTGVSNTSLSYAGASDADIDAMFDLIRAGKGFDKLYVDNTMDFGKILNLIKYSVRRHGIKYVVVDYVQLLELSGYKFKDMQTYEKYKEVSRQFKLIAQSLDITVILLGQQNDDALDDKTPMGRRLAGAKSMQNDADVVVAFRKKSTKELNEDGIENGNLIVNIDKVRYNQSQVVFFAYMNPNSLKIKEI